MALLETCVSSSRAVGILTHSHFTNLEVVEAVGFARGIWLFWDNTKIQVELISSHDQILNVLCMDPTGGRPWMLSVLYAFLYPLIR